MQAHASIEPSFLLLHVAGHPAFGISLLHLFQQHWLHGLTGLDAFLCEERDVCRRPLSKVNVAAPHHIQERVVFDGVSADEAHKEKQQKHGNVEANARPRVSGLILVVDRVIHINSSDTGHDEMDENHPGGEAATERARNVQEQRAEHAGKKVDQQKSASAGGATLELLAIVVRDITVVVINGLPLWHGNVRKVVQI